MIFFGDSINVRFVHDIEMGKYTCPCCKNENWAYIKDIKELWQFECMACREKMLAFGLWKLTMESVVDAVTKEQI